MNKDKESVQKIKMIPKTKIEKVNESILSKRRLSGTGYVCAQTDRKEFRSIPSVLVLFEKVLTKEEFTKALRDNVVSVPKNFRLRCRLNEKKNRFVEIPNFIEKHLPNVIRYVTLNNDDDVTRIIERDIFKPFKNAMWEVVVFPNYSKGMLVWFRNHHCLGDGVALCQTYIEMCEEKYAYRQMMVKKFAKHLTFWSNVRHYLWLILSFIPVMFFFLVNFLTFEKQLHKPVSSDQKNVNFVWNKSFSVSDLKKIGRKFGLTINEIFVALISDAMSDYYDPKKECTVRISVPVNCRTFPLAKKLCNYFGVSWISIPVDKKISWNERVKKIKKSSVFMKRWPFHHYMYYFSSYISPLFPIRMLRYLLNMLSSNYQSLNMSNVFGSPIELTLKKSKILDMVFFIPASISGSMAFSILSYSNNVTLGLVSDKMIIRQPKKIIKCVQERYRKLLMDLKDKSK